jgi:hypothetical protein
MGERRTEAAMITIDFKVPMRDVYGKIAQHQGREMILSDSLAEALGMNAGKIKARKAVGWARGLGRGEVLALDESDFDDLAEYIEEVAPLVTVCKVSCLEVMDEAKAKAENRGEKK